MMNTTSQPISVDIQCDSVLSLSSRWTLRGENAKRVSLPVSRDPASGVPESELLACACCAGANTNKFKQPLTTDDECDFSSDAETWSRSSSFRSVSRSSSDNDVASLAAMDDVAVEAEHVSEMQEQSPIDICALDSTRLTVAEGGVTISLCEAEAELMHQGANFLVSWESGEHNTLTIHGKIYHAVQFHFHTPSEHTLDGNHEAMEFHMVHQAADGTLAVLAVFFREGAENAFLAQFWDKLPELGPELHDQIPVGRIDPRGLGVHFDGVFRYRGSLTTPPYTESVEWVVVQNVAEASREQLDTFRRTIPGPNARPVQPLNKRHVSFVH